MRASEWRFFRVRPGNQPHKRIGAAAQIILSCLEAGFVKKIVGMILEVDYKRPELALESSLRLWAPAGEDPETAPGNRGPLSSFLGRRRTADIVVNVALPFSYGWASVFGEASMQAKALAIYRNYPKLEPNYITRLMARRLLGRADHKVVNSARRQQGLIHIYKSCCLNGGCSRCSLAEIAVNAGQR